jgi:magnesium-transporting ATPase (P-type)
MRNFITNTGIIVGSLFWSSLVTSINDLAATADLPQYQQQYLSVLIVLVCLLVLPFIFDFLARYYEGIKLESEIQATIMTRYFWYQLINVYVTVGFGGVQIVTQILMILKNPQLLVNFVGQTIPSVSLYFVDMVIVKIFTAVPLEMIRPWQIITIHLMSRCMDRRKTTRRDLRTGAFYAWPMLYGWIYPQVRCLTG